MHISDVLAGPSPTISFEIFPPKNSEGEANLGRLLASFQTLNPAFISVTCGAAGSARHTTLKTVKKVKEETNIHSVPHLTCMGQKKEDIDSILAAYAELGVGNILALRGDPPREAAHKCNGGGAFAQGIDLVKYISGFNGRGAHPDPRGFGIGVAGYPEGHPAAPNRLVEMDHLKAKVDAGAHYICTQVFYDNRDFYDFRDRCELAGIRVPILAGILPLQNPAQMNRMAALAGRMRYPAALLKALQRAGGHEATFASILLHYSIHQCHDLLNNGVAGLHFYTMNSTEPVTGLLAVLGRHAVHAPVVLRAREMI